MKRFINILLSALCVCLALESGQLWGRDIAPIKLEVEVEEPIRWDAPVTMHLKYEVTESGIHAALEQGDFTILFLDPRDRTDTLYKRVYPVHYDESYSHAQTIQLELPQDMDTVKLKVIPRCGLSYRYTYYFAKSGGDVLFTNYIAMPQNRENQENQRIQDYYSRDILIDTLSHEQLQIEEYFGIDLSDPEHYRIAKELLDSIPKSSEFKGFKNQYQIKMKRQTALELYRLGVPIEGTPPPRKMKKINH